MFWVRTKDSQHIMVTNKHSYQTRLQSKLVLTKCKTRAWKHSMVYTVHLLVEIGPKVWANLVLLILKSYGLPSRKLEVLVIWSMVLWFYESQMQ